METSNTKTLINSLHFADVHLESDAIDTRDTIKGIWHIIDQVPAETLDLISFDGDVFDKAMIVPASKLKHIILFVSRLIDYCVQYNIYLRVLEGTPIHDRGQSDLFETIAEIKGATHLVRWVSTLEIEHIKELGMTIMYVPDEWNHDNDVTLQQAQHLLKKEGLTKVHCISMHGSFLYQINGILTRPHHLEQPWMDMCEFFINIGHVHGHSTYKGVILVTGSTNRTAHGEERPKGAIITTINLETGAKSWKFIENPYATIFKTIDARGMSIDEVGVAIDNLKLPKGSNLRLLLNKNDEVLMSFGRIKNHYDQYKMKRKVEDVEVIKRVELGSLAPQSVGISLTYDNLNTQLSEFVKHTLGDDWLKEDTECLEYNIKELNNEL